MALEQFVGEAVRRLRQRRRVSVRTLAGKCGYSPSFISQVELNQASPSLASLERIATAIGVTIGELFHAARPSVPNFVRSSQRVMIQSRWSRSQIESLRSSGIGGRLEAVLVTLHHKGSSGSQLHTSNSEQFALIISGSVMLELANDTYVLRRGDAITIPAVTPHRWENKGTKDAQLLQVTPR